MIKTIEKSNNPTRKIDLLLKVKDLVLVDMIRYSWWNLSDSVKECNINENEVFSFTSGPLALCFSSGIILGAASDPSMNSVVIWQDELEDGSSLIEKPMKKDSEIFPIPVNKDDKKWKSILKEKVSSFTVIKSKPDNPKLIDLPNEVGLIVSFENGDELVLSHGLHEVYSDDFSVIKKDSISKKLVDELTYHELSI